MTFRKEFKFLMSSSDQKILKSDLIKSGMKMLFPGRIVHSCYLDTKDLLLFYLSDEGVLPRKKIRYRWYNNDNLAKQEIKISSIEGRYKSFVKQSVSNFKFYKNVYHDNDYGPLIATLNVSYFREYYLYRGLRITFDYNILYTDLIGMNKLELRDFETVVEVKTPIDTPDDYIAKVINLQPARFSKYCRGIILHRS